MNDCRQHNGIERIEPRSSIYFKPTFETAMHYDAHQPIINDLEARILTLRDSL
jgi:hypothetical protein